jgi:hypothetical protein
MKTGRKRHRGLNVLIGITVLGCLLAFAIHSRNWMRLQEGRMQVLSGVYYLEVPFAELDSVRWQEKIPQMERRHGFSFWAREKGVFTDSLFPSRPVYVFVDDLRQPKIRIAYRDSLTFFLNFSDSAETRSVYHLLREKMQAAPSR